MEEADTTNELSGVAAEDSGKTRPAVRDEDSGNGAGLSTSPTITEFAQLSEKIQRTPLSVLARPQRPHQNKSESFTEALAEAHEAVGEAGQDALEIERVRHAADLEKLNLQAKLDASLSYGTSSWEQFAYDNAHQFWCEVQDLVGGIWRSLAAAETDELADDFNPRLSEETESAMWWLKQVRHLSIEQFTAAMALGFGRPEDEIARTLEIARHEILFWRENVQEFQEAVRFWRGQWDCRAEGVEQRVIDTLAKHEEPKHQKDAVGMMNQRKRTADAERRTDIAEDGLELAEKRDEFLREQALKGYLPQGLPGPVNLMIVTGQMRDTKTPALEAARADVIEVEAEGEDEADT